MAAVDVLSPLTGSVALLRAEDGARVERGDTVLEVESMKTFWPVEAPASGIVRLQVALGEVVGENQLVAIIETPG